MDARTAYAPSPIRRAPKIASVRRAKRQARSRPSVVSGEWSIPSGVTMYEIKDPNSVPEVTQALPVARYASQVTSSDSEPGEGSQTNQGPESGRLNREFPSILAASTAAFPIGVSWSNAADNRLPA